MPIETGGVDPSLAVAVLGLLALALLARAVVGFVPSGHRGVVMRAGRAVRTARPGPVLTAPLVERVELIEVGLRSLEPVTASAVTADGVEVRATLSVLWQVTRPRSAALLEGPPEALVMDVVERATHRLVGERELTAVLHDRLQLVGLVPEAVRPLLEPWGCEVVDVDLLDLEVRVGAELLRLLK